MNTDQLTAIVERYSDLQALLLDDSDDVNAAIDAAETIYEQLDDVERRLLAVMPANAPTPFADMPVRLVGWLKFITDGEIEPADMDNALSRLATHGLITLDIGRSARITALGMVADFVSMFGDE